MVSSYSSDSTSEGSQNEKCRNRKRKRDDSPTQERRTNRKESSSKNKPTRDYSDGRFSHKSGRNTRRESPERMHRDRSQKDYDDVRNYYRDHSKREYDSQNGRKKYDGSPPRREDGHARQREYEERGRERKDAQNDYKRRHEHDKRKRSSFDDMTKKKEPIPQWGKPSIKDEPKPIPKEKEKPNFELSGKLTEDANMVNNVVIKYSEPQDARKPKRRWRLYPFKGEKALPTLYVHRQSAYLMGRDRKVADIPLDHPSCSKQHAALQYRLVSFKKEGGAEGRRIRPYLIDLDSANGTFVNNVKLEARRYHELLERDVIRFGFSSREYVLLHELSKDDSLDDDIPITSVT